MRIELAFITYNRLEYTKLALEALFADQTEDFQLSIWDNGSTDGTREYLSEVQDSRIHTRTFAKENVYITGAANAIFSKSSADLVGIIPDDFLVTPGWTRTLARAHADVKEFGFLGCWHAGPEFLDLSRARKKKKIQEFNGHKILRHPWTGGGAGLVKLASWRECGPFEGISTPECWIRMARKGYVNGFYLPAIFVEHMDYPWSKYCIRKPNTVNEIREKRGVYTTEDEKRFHQGVVQSILDGPWDVKYYVGWRAKIRDKYNGVSERFSKLLRLNQ